LAAPQPVQNPPLAAAGAAAAGDAAGEAEVAFVPTGSDTLTPVYVRLWLPMP